MLESEPDHSFLDRTFTEKAKRWQRTHAATPQRRKAQDLDFYSDFSVIRFPDAAGLRHAALVVAGAMSSRPDAVAATREILEALAIPEIMAAGGDGRPVKVGKPSNRGPGGEWETEARAVDRFLADAERTSGRPRRGRPRKDRDA